MANVRSGNRRARLLRSKKIFKHAADLHVGEAPHSKALIHGVDFGPSLTVPPEPYIASAREPGWGPHLDGFLARNRKAFSDLSLEPRIISGRDGVRLELQPGLRAGSIPLCSAVTGQVGGGVIIAPRFGWRGIGSILSATGWGSGPEFLNLPLVPGSGREIPPWVLAGPVIRRIAELLAHLRPGYRERNEVRTHPRGQIQWPTYLTRQMPTGRWHHLPCRFSELDTDSRLRQAVRWVLERIHADLGTAGGSDRIALGLIEQVSQLMKQLIDVDARRPNRSELDEGNNRNSFGSAYLRDGLRAMSWIVDERGLGGGRNSDGLAWTISLETLWERYVEYRIRDEVGRSGGRVRVGRLRETTVPISWNDPSHRALGHLVPDFVIQRSDGIEIVDAKYKAHFADLDATRWSAFTEEAQASMRADLHQILAYAAVVGTNGSIRATLVYPVRRELFDELQLRNRDRVEARIPTARGDLSIQMRAMSMGVESL